MKTISKWLMTLLWLIVPFLTFLPSAHSFADVNTTRVAFENIDLSQASRSGKKIMVSFTAEWCLPCRFMEEQLYNDSEIADLVNNNFVAIKADVDTPQGKEWNSLYNSDYLPTILFSDRSGVEFERINRAPTRAEFIEVLNRVIAISAAPYRAHNHSTGSLQIIDASAEPTETYSLQLGAFASFDNASKRVHRLATIEDLPLMILEETNSEGILLYKVLCSELASQKEAETKMRILKTAGIEAFVRK